MKRKIEVLIYDDGDYAHINDPFVGIIYGRNVEDLKNLLELMEKACYNIVDFEEENS